MKFIANGTKYEMDDAKITFAEARAVEKVTGRTMSEIERSGEDITTVQAMIWVAMKRADPSLRFTDLDDMPMGEIEWLPDDDQATDADPADPADPTQPGDEPGEDSTPSE